MCNYTCEDIQALHETIVNLTTVVNGQQDDLDMLIGKFQDLQARVTILEGYQSVSSSQVKQCSQDIDDLYIIINQVTVDAADTCIQSVRDDGIRIGNNWWFGEQGEYLFAINTKQTSYYRFEGNCNKTL